MRRPISGTMFMPIANVPNISLRLHSSVWVCLGLLLISPPFGLIAAWSYLGKQGLGGLRGHSLLRVQNMSRSETGLPSWTFWLPVGFPLGTHAVCHPDLGQVYQLG